MADEHTVVSSKKPNMRFGTSFLNTKFRQFAARDEVMLDKSSGEVAFRRKEDGAFIYFNREDINIENWLLSMKSAYGLDLKSVRPTKKNCLAISSTYMMGVQYDLEEFSSNIKDENGEDVVDFTQGASLRNPNVSSFNVSHEMNGVFVEVKANPRAVPLVNLLTGVYDRYFESYDGNVSDYDNQKHKLKKDRYKGSSVEIGMTITYYNKDTTKDVVEQIGYCNLNTPTYIPFIPRDVYSRDDVDYIRLSLNYITLPKVKYAMEIKDTEFTPEELAYYEKAKDIEQIELKCLDMFVYNTITDNHFKLPDESTKLIALMEASTVEDSFDRLDKMIGSPGLICSIKTPSKEDWERVNLWAERIRHVGPGGALDYTGSETDLGELEDYFGRVNEIESEFVYEINRYGFYVEITGEENTQLLW